LRDEIRNDSQIRQARETANNELRGLLGQFKSLLGDMAGLFPIEFLDDVTAEVADITTEIKEDWDNFTDKGDRFLGGEDEEIADDTTPDDSPSELGSEDEVNEVVETIETIDVIVEDEQEDDSPDEKVLSATKLAQRLGFSSHHEVTNQFKALSQEEFIEWTKSLDPDGYGWDKVNGKYRVVA